MTPLKLAEIAEEKYPMPSNDIKDENTSLTLSDVVRIRRAAFIAGDQRDRWISIDEQPPTEKDSDEWGKILGWDRITGRVQYAHWPDVVQMRMRFNLWQPLPSPPSNH